MTGRDAEKEVKNQGKNLLKDRSEVEQFINYFPGENTKDKILSFVNLFGLEKAGYWHPNGKKWGNVGSVGYVELSKVDGNDHVYGVTWNSGSADISRHSQRFPSPCLPCEDC